MDAAKENQGAKAEEGEEAAVVVQAGHVAEALATGWQADLGREE